jgi:predicted transposase YbfD/YdcC
MQAAVVRRKSGNRKRETVYLLTSLEPDRLSPQQWLRLNRQAWGIENGLHQRLDVSAFEDLCRVRNRSAVWILGMFRRLAISVYSEWRHRNPRRSKYSSLTDFFHLLSHDNNRRGLALLSSRSPSLSYNVS